MKIDKFYILGIANGLKPKIILETIISMDLLPKSKIELLTDANEGILVDYCRDQKLNYHILDRNNLMSFFEDITISKHSLLVTIAWNVKLSGDFLNKFQKCINCHGGLLPDYRGNNTYMHAYANVEDYYGVTFII